MKRICLIMAAALFLAGFNALADARQHFLAGQDYYSQGRYEKAVEEFEEAYRLDPRPLLLYNIAQAHEKMGHLVKAVDYLKRYLEADPDTDERTTLLNKVANLEARIAKTGIKVTSNEAEAIIYIDGKEVGTTPVAGVIPLEVGAHKVQVSKKGFEDFKMNLAVSSGQTTPVEVTLEPGLSGPAPVADLPDEGEGEEEGEGEGEEEPEEDGKKVDPLDVVPWVVTGVGAIGAGVGWGVLGSMAKSAQPSEDLKDTDYDQYKKKQDDAHTKAVVADVVGAVGAAIAVGGLVWGIMRITKKGGDEEEVPAEGEADVAVVPFFGGDSGGVVATVQF